MSDKYDDIVFDDFTYVFFPKETEEQSKFLYEHVYEYCWGFSISLNDTFGYAVGDTDYIVADDWEDLKPLVYEFKHDAIHAYFSLKLDVDVIKPLQTKGYFRCKELIRELKDNHDLFHFFDYGQGHTRLGRELDLDRDEIYETYMKWVNEVSEELDWKTQFGPKEIVNKICEIIEKKS